jgi:DNA-binding CsgD family transcriptional regulator
MVDDRSQNLTERQLECLRLVYTHHTIQEIAARLSLTVEGVNYHLTGARKILGIGSSAAAARLVFGAKLPSEYISHVAAPNTVVPPAENDSFSPSDEDPDGQENAAPMLQEMQAEYTADFRSQQGRGLRLPIRTGGRPTNDLTPWEVLAWGLGIAFLAVALLGAMMSLQHAPR